MKKLNMQGGYMGFILRMLFVAIFSTTAMCWCVIAQPELPKECQASLPKILEGIILHEKDADALNDSRDFGQSDTVKQYWTAYSDRENNTTYMEPDASSAQCSALRFNETVRIAKIQNGFALVYVEPDRQIEYPLISADAKCRGWVPMKKLLLWNICLANENGICNKALLCLNLDKSYSKINDFGKGYYGPSDSSSSMWLSTDMNFYYVMKRENGMTLLASQSKMDGAFSDQVLFCWVQEQSFVSWNTRLCLEPTWKHEDVEYFADHNIKLNFYENDRFDSDPITQISFYKKESPVYDPYLYRMKGDNIRYPILDGCSADAYKMWISCPPSYELEYNKIARSNMPGYIKRMRNINIAIVIDGKSFMKPYYPAVKEAIKSSVQYFEKNNYNVKVGAVIYRDYADGEAGLVEVCPMTDVENIASVNNFLDTGGCYGIRSRAGNNQSGALYYGLGKALDTLRFNKNESNIMLVVGGCGNDVKDAGCPSQKDIISKIVDRNVHLMGFQVLNRNASRGFAEFNFQMRHLIRTSLSEKYRQLHYEHGKENYVRISSHQINDAAGVFEGCDFEAEVEPRLYIGAIRSADADVNNGKIDPRILTEHMTSAISDFASTVRLNMDIIHKCASELSNEINGKGSEITNVERNIIHNLVGIILIDWFSPTINFRGYAKKKDDSSGRDFFKPVVFISMEELDDLLKRLAPVHEAALRSDVKDRTPYIEAIKALVLHLATGISDRDMARLTNEQVQEMIHGLHGVEGEVIRKYTLDDLSNPKVIPAAEYHSIINDFSRKYRNLERIRTSKNYKFVKEFNGTKYYWIPVEDLPL